MKAGNRFFAGVFSWLLILAAGVELAPANAEEVSAKHIWVDPVRGTASGERGNRKKPFNEIGSITVLGRSFVTNGALSVARSGDTIVLSAGYLTNRSSIWCVSGVRIQGAGMDKTFVYATNCNEYGLGGPVVALSSGSVCRDFTIVCSTNTAQAGIGTDYRGSYNFSYRYADNGQLTQRVVSIRAGACTNALVQRVKVATGRDCVYVLHTNACSVTFQDCIFEGNWDGGILFGNAASVLDFRRCTFRIDGLLPPDLDRNYVDGFLVDLGTANFNHCEIVAINGPLKSYGLRNLRGTINASDTRVIAFGSPYTAPFGAAGDAPVNQHRSAAYTTISIGTNGPGVVQPDFNGRLLKVGDSIRLSASAVPGYIWAGWTDGGGTGTNLYSTTFTVQPNMTLEANFVSNPFPAVQGNYLGLILEPGLAASNHVGFFSFNLSSQGALTGKFIVDGRTHSIGSSRGANRVHVDGLIQLPLPNSDTGMPGLTVELQFDLTNQTGVVTGRVTDTAALPADGTVTSQPAVRITDLQGKRADLAPRLNPIPQAGTYKLVFRDNPGGGARETGSATLKVNSRGQVSLAGLLSDGTAISQSSRLSSDGSWPLFVKLPKGRGTLLGWLAFTDGTGSDLLGSVTWIKPSDAPGDANKVVSLEVIGSQDK